MSSPYAMSHRLIAAGLLIALFLWTGPASATVFIFNQTSASVPGLFITSAISIKWGHQ